MIVEVMLAVFGLILLLEALVNKVANADKLVIKVLLILGVVNVTASIILFILK